MFSYSECRAVGHPVSEFLIPSDSARLFIDSEKRLKKQCVLLKLMSHLRKHLGRIQLRTGVCQPRGPRLTLNACPWPPGVLNRASPDALHLSESMAYGESKQERERIENQTLQDE